MILKIPTGLGLAVVKRNMMRRGVHNDNAVSSMSILVSGGIGIHFY